jgi:hypothetical protein
MPSDRDPLSLGELEPVALSAAVDQRAKGKVKPPSELDLKKEERLSKKEERLTSGKASAPAQLPPGPFVAPVDPSPLLDKIAAYKERFAHLRSRNPKLSAKSSIEEIEDELHYLELQLGSSKDGSLAQMLFVSSMSGLETVTRDYYNPLGLNLTGLGAVAKDNVGEVSDMLDELMIKYSAGFYLQPEYRLAIAMAGMVMTVHSANSGDPRVAEAVRKMQNVAKPPAGSESM